MHSVRTLVVLAACGLVSVLSACEDEDLNHIPLPGSVSGQICDPGEGRGLSGARVYVLVGEGAQEQTIETSTDADGHFVLEGVPIGEHTVFVQRGSFHTEVAGIVVDEESDTPLAEGETCVAPAEVSMIVYDGHDNVQDVLGRLGYSGFEVVDTHHEFEEHDETTPSWMIAAFSDYVAVSRHDIIFINCAAHEWALDETFATAEVEIVLANLRRFVAEGGSLYLSDWSYDLLERLYPDAVDWAHDDSEPNSAEVGLAQDFLAEIVDEDLRAFLQQGQILLRYELSRIAVPRNLGPGSRALVLAEIDAEGETEEDVVTYQRVPVLLEHQPTVLGVESADVGRVIYTTFHNGQGNTRDMDEILRAIVFSL